MKQKNKSHRQRHRKYTYQRFSKGIKEAIQDISRKYRSINRRNIGSSVVLTITLLGSIGSAVAIFSVPEVRSLLDLDDITGTPRTASSSWKAYEKNSDFTIMVPDNWKIQDNRDVLDGTQLVLVPTKKGILAEDVYLSIVVEDASQIPLTLEEYSLSIESMIDLGLEESEIVNKKESIVGGSPAMLVEYKGINVDKVLTQFMQAVIFDKNNLFLVTYSAPSSTFRDFQEEAREIIDSLEIVKR